MKKFILVTLTLVSISGYCQEHFAGLNSSSRVGIMNVGLNPAELTNMSNKFETNITGFSFNVANNKIGFSDLTSDKNIEDLIFTGTEPVNMNFDAEIYGIGFAIKHQKWAFAITTKATAKLTIVDVDTKLGDAITTAGLNSIFGATTINNNYNQRINGTTWGEIGLTGARTLVDNVKHKFNAGVTFKLLFPGSYANLGADKFNGTITQVGGQAYLNNTVANLNVAYSGGLANSFSNFDDYTKSIFGGLNGFAGDIGLNYQLKDTNAVNDAINNGKNNKNKYKLNAGLSVKNIGSMTFKDDNNYATNYVLSIQSTVENPLGLNLNLFENTESLADVEATLIANGYLNKTQAEKKEFKVKLPTSISAYADIKLISKLYISAFMQQKMSDNNENDQITTQNVITITPRINIGFFEAFVPISNSEISGFNTGVGFRLGGFYLGSGSIVTALINDSKQADIYTGFRWGFL